MTAVTSDVLLIPIDSITAPAGRLNVEWICQTPGHGGRHPGNTWENVTPSRPPAPVKFRPETTVTVWSRAPNVGARTAPESGCPRAPVVKHEPMPRITHNRRISFMTPVPFLAVPSLIPASEGPGP